MPETNKPDTWILTDEDLVRIQSLPITTNAIRDALCQTVRAAWANEARLAKEVVELRERLERA